MNIVIEGMDASGKSTLAMAISRALNLPIQGSEGPPLYPGEMDTRIRGYFARRRDMIYDRHPVVSETIYRVTRPESPEISPELVKEFYEQRPILIYCDPLERGLKDHQTKHHDSETHLSKIAQSYHLLLRLYRQWAIRHALVMYRIGDNMSTVVDLVERAYAGRSCKRFDPLP